MVTCRVVFFLSWSSTLFIELNGFSASFVYVPRKTWFDRYHQHQHHQQGREAYNKYGRRSPLRYQSQPSDGDGECTIHQIVWKEDPEWYKTYVVDILGSDFCQTKWSIETSNDDDESSSNTLTADTTDDNTVDDETILEEIDTNVIETEETEVSTSTALDSVEYSSNSITTPANDVNTNVQIQDIPQVEDNADDVVVEDTDDVVAEEDKSQLPSETSGPAGSTEKSMKQDEVQSEDDTRVVVCTRITPKGRKKIISYQMIEFTRLGYSPTDLERVRADNLSVMLQESVQRPRMGIPPHWKLHPKEDSQVTIVANAEEAEMMMMGLSGPGREKKLEDSELKLSDDKDSGEEDDSYQKQEDSSQIPTIEEASAEGEQPVSSSSSSEPVLSSGENDDDADAATETAITDERMVLYRALDKSMVYVPLEQLTRLGYTNVDEIVSLQADALCVIVQDKARRPKLGIPPQWKINNGLGDAKSSSPQIQIVKNLREAQMIVKSTNDVDRRRRLVETESVKSSEFQSRQRRRRRRLEEEDVDVDSDDGNVPLQRNRRETIGDNNYPMVNDKNDNDDGDNNKMDDRSSTTKLQGRGRPTRRVREDMLTKEKEDEDDDDDDVVKGEGRVNKNEEKGDDVESIRPRRERLSVIEEDDDDDVSKVGRSGDGTDNRRTRRQQRERRGARVRFEELTADDDDDGDNELPGTSWRNGRSDGRGAKQQQQQQQQQQQRDSPRRSNGSGRVKNRNRNRRERASVNPDGTAKSIYTFRQRQQQQQQKKVDTRPDPPKPDLPIWVDMDTFRGLLRREAELRLRVLGDNWTPTVKKESDWRLDLYKRWLWALHDGVGESFSTRFAGPPPAPPASSSSSQRRRRSRTASTRGREGTARPKNPARVRARQDEEDGRGGGRTSTEQQQQQRRQRRPPPGPGPGLSAEKGDSPRSPRQTTTGTTTSSTRRPKLNRTSTTATTTDDDDDDDDDDEGIFVDDGDDRRRRRRRTDGPRPPPPPPRTTTRDRQ